MAPGPLAALVIEDDLNLASLFSQALRRAAFEVETLNDGQAALTRLQAARPDLVVLDMYLPGISGQDLLAFIRSEVRLRGVKVIVATADPRLAAAVRSRADLVLVKPISFNQLRDQASALFSR